MWTRDHYQYVQPKQVKKGGKSKVGRHYGNTTVEA